MEGLPWLLGFCLPLLGGADSIPAQRDRTPHALQPKNQKYKKQKQHHNKFDKNFRTVYIKKKIFKKVSGHHQVILRKAYTNRCES